MTKKIKVPAVFVAPRAKDFSRLASRAGFALLFGTLAWMSYENRNSMLLIFFSGAAIVSLSTLSNTPFIGRKVTAGLLAAVSILFFVIGSALIGVFLLAIAGIIVASVLNAVATYSRTHNYCFDDNVVSTSTPVCAEGEADAFHRYYF